LCDFGTVLVSLPLIPSPSPHLRLVVCLFVRALSYTTVTLDFSSPAMSSLLKGTDPSGLTVARLRQWLTAHDVAVPQTRQTKATLSKLARDHYRSSIAQTDSAVFVLPKTPKSSRNRKSAPNSRRRRSTTPAPAPAPIPSPVPSPVVADEPDVKHQDSDDEDEEPVRRASRRRNKRSHTEQQLTESMSRGRSTRSSGNSSASRTRSRKRVKAETKTTDHSDTPFPRGSVSRLPKSGGDAEMTDVAPAIVEEESPKTSYVDDSVFVLPAAPSSAKKSARRNSSRRSSSGRSSSSTRRSSSSTRRSVPSPPVQDFTSTNSSSPSSSVIDQDSELFEASPYTLPTASRYGSQPEVANYNPGSFNTAATRSVGSSIFEPMSPNEVQPNRLEFPSRRTRPSRVARPVPALELSQLEARNIRQQERLRLLEQAADEKRASDSKAKKTKKKKNKKEKTKSSKSSSSDAISIAGSSSFFSLENVLATVALTLGLVVMGVMMLRGGSSVSFCDTGAPIIVNSTCAPCPDNGVCMDGYLTCAEGFVLSGKFCDKSSSTIALQEQAKRAVVRHLEAALGDKVCAGVDDPQTEASVLRSSVKDMLLAQQRFNSKASRIFVEEALDDLQQNPEHHNIEVLSGEPVAFRAKHPYITLTCSLWLTFLSNVQLLAICVGGIVVALVIGYRIKASRSLNAAVEFNLKDVLRFLEIEAESSLKRGGSARISKGEIRGHYLDVPSPVMDRVFDRLRSHHHVQNGVAPDIDADGLAYRDEFFVHTPSMRRFKSRIDAPRT
jgi:Man1-Src1p-C-terminal domain